MSRDLDVRTATLTYTMGGTPLYYAPERLLMQPATRKGDLYALGLIA
jgi:serine/threonine protein kinase